MDRIEVDFRLKDGSEVTVKLPRDLSGSSIPKDSEFLRSRPPNWIPVSRGETLKWYRKA